MNVAFCCDQFALPGLYLSLYTLVEANPELVPGVWKNLTPEGVTMTLDNHVFAQGLAVDPKTPTTLYLCVCAYDAKQGGLFKTTDAGFPAPKCLPNARECTRNGSADNG